MTVKERLRLLVEGLSEEQAAELLRLLEGRTAPGGDSRATGVRALDELRDLVADLPPFDAVQAAAEARRELDQRQAM